MKTLLYGILIMLTFACEVKKRDDFLVDRVFPDLYESSKHHPELLEFKETPFDSIITKSTGFKDIVLLGVETLRRDSVYNAQFYDRLADDGMYFDHPEDVFVFAGMFHQWLNDNPINKEKVQNHYREYYAKKAVLASRHNSTLDREDLECDFSILKTIHEWLTTDDRKLNYYDADFLLHLSHGVCLRDNVEFSQMYNEALHFYIQQHPNHLLELMNEGAYGQQVQKAVLKEIESPIHDGIDLQKSLNSLRAQKDSAVKDLFIKAIKKAISKSSQ